MTLRFVVHHHKSKYDDFIISNETVEEYKQKLLLKDHKFLVFDTKDFNCYLVAALVTLVKTSDVCKQKVQLLVQGKRPQDVVVVLFHLEMPKKQFLDYKWGERMVQLALERKEIDYAMSWLSTLGGAFSAMGDHFQRCALVAGKISNHQLKLALRIGDPHQVARCQLYACLSLIQQNKFKIPRQHIPNVLSWAKKVQDVQLQRMCLGIWAKLRYQRTKFKEEQAVK